jgi:hypothetical protein
MRQKSPKATLMPPVAPKAAPKAAVELVDTIAVPPMAIDCKFANRLPQAIKGSVDCHHAARDPACTPAAQNPAEHSHMGMSRLVMVTAAALPTTPPPTKTRAAHSGDISKAISAWGTAVERSSSHVSTVLLG